MLAITVAPCSDFHESKNTERTEKHNHSEDEHHDDCSPFCVCDCCSISVVNSEMIVELEEKTSKSIVYFHYSFDYSFDYYFNVWNPPKFI